MFPYCSCCSCLVVVFVDIGIVARKEYTMLMILLLLLLSLMFLIVVAVDEYCRFVTCLQLLCMLFDIMSSALICVPQKTPFLISTVFSHS